MLRLIKPKKNPEYVCLYQPYPGLGDHLQYSTLPRLYSMMGKKVLISSKNNYRNEEIKELVWGNNPYVEGFSELKPNIGLSCDNIQKRAVKVWKQTSVSIENIEAAHGFANKNPRPEVYYRCNCNKDLSSVCLVDASACSSFGNYTKDLILSILKNNFKNIMFLKSRKMKHKDYEDLSCSYFDTFYVNDIFEYCDAIKSCGSFVSLMSGGHSLMQALRNDRSYCIISNELYEVHYKKGIFLNDSCVTYIKF